MEKRKRMTLTEIDRVPDFGVVQSDSDVDREILFKQANTLRNDMRSIIGVLKAENAELRKRVKELVISNLEYVMADTEILREVLMLNPLLKSQIRAVLSYAEDARGLIIGDAALAGGKE